MGRHLNQGRRSRYIFQKRFGFAKVDYITAWLRYYLLKPIYGNLLYIHFYFLLISATMQSPIQSQIVQINLKIEESVGGP